MGKIKDWIMNLPSIVHLLILLVATNLAVNFVSAKFGRTYEKYYPNKNSYELALSEFKRICAGYSVEYEDEFESQYYEFYDDKNKAIGDFMTLAYALNKEYANGRFKHIYVLGKERIYRCCDKDKNRIAMRLRRHRVLGYGTSYELNFFVEKY